MGSMLQRQGTQVSYTRGRHRTAALSIPSELPNVLLSGWRLAQAFQNAKCLALPEALSNCSAKLGRTRGTNTVRE
jgi:hypothetical protein